MLAANAVQTTVMLSMTQKSLVEIDWRKVSRTIQRIVRMASDKFGITQPPSDTVP